MHPNDSILNEKELDRRSHNHYGAAVTLSGKTVLWSKLGYKRYIALHISVQW